MQEVSLDQRSVVRWLRRHPIWHDAADTAIATLAARGLVVKAPPGENILTAGQPADAIHLLAEGRVRVFYPAAGGIEVTLKLLAAPAAFGDAESIMQTTWAETVQALTPCTALRFDARIYFKFLRREPVACFRQYWDVARRFGVAIQTEKHANLASICERTIAVLLAYAQEFGRNTTAGRVIEHVLTLEDLACQTASNRRTIVRVLEDLYGLGLLERVGRKFRIPSEKRLLQRAALPVPRLSFKTERPWAENP